jgi:hypothetical protein
LFWFAFLKHFCRSSSSSAKNNRSLINLNRNFPSVHLKQSNREHQKGWIKIQCQVFSYLWIIF